MLYMQYMENFTIRRKDNTVIPEPEAQLTGKFTRQNFQIPFTGYHKPVKPIKDSHCGRAIKLTYVSTRVI